MPKRLGYEEKKAAPALDYDPALLKIDHEAPKGLTLQDMDETRKRLDRVTDRLLEESGGVLRDLLAYADADFDQDGNLKQVPEQWDKELANDPVALARRIRMARFGQMTNANAPNANKLAAQIYIGILKARSQEQAGPRTLNVAVVQLTAPPTQFSVMEIE